MTLGAGTRLGPYEVVAPLGAGGMGEVYRASDTKLGREVAVKVLPADMNRDAFSLDRFEREAKAVAALSHPNVVRIFDYGREGDQLYAVMELLEGETLRRRMSGRPLPLSKAVDIARGVAEGLSAAHEKEIVHRDLKPDNVFLTTDGRVKILDFGLAKVDLPLGFEEDAPTAPLSQPGALLGTIEYMSPEQLRSQETDHRSDIFALGLLLYEMLCGRRPFQRESLAETMSAILSQDPAPLETDRPLPAALEQILVHCLEKQPEERFQSARDLAFALAGVSVTTTSGQASGILTGYAPPAARRSWLPVALAAVGGLVAFSLGLWIGGLRSPQAISGSHPSFQRLTTLPGLERSPKLGPDGKAFVYVSGLDGDDDIYLQRIGGQKPINLTEDSGADDSGPAFSPDGETIAFRSERLGGGVFLMGATGESVRRLSDHGYDPAWSPDGTEIVVAGEAVVDPLFRTTTSSLHVVSVPGGERRLLTEGDAVQPAWSPGGHRIAYFSTPSTGQRDLWTIDASGRGEPVPVTQDEPTEWSPLWSPDGNWLYFSSDRGGSMSPWRVAIDEETGQVLGDPEPVIVPAFWAGELARNHDGTRFVYATRASRSTLYRVQIDPKRGRIVGRAEPVLVGALDITSLHLNPTGDRIVFSTRGVREDIFVVDIDGTGFSQLTNDSFRDRGPQWSRDSERIAFYSNRSGHYELWTLHADGSGLEQVTDLPEGRGLWYPTWSPDGSMLAVAHPDGSSLIELGEPDRPAPLPTIDENLVFQVSTWSSDGLRLAGFARARDSAERLGGLWTYSLMDGSYERLTEEGLHPLWVGKGPTMIATRDSGIALFDPGPDRWSPLVDVPIGVSWRKFAVSGDGETLIYIETEEDGDVWLMSQE